jgi:hypothetical protein
MLPGGGNCAARATASGVRGSFPMGRLAPQQDGDPDTRLTTAVCSCTAPSIFGKKSEQEQGRAKIRTQYGSRRSPAPTDASIGEENPWFSCLKKNPWFSSSFFIGRRQIGLLRVVQASDKFAICCHGIMKNRARHSCFTSMLVARVQFLEAA